MTEVEVEIPGHFPVECDVPRHGIVFTALRKCDAAKTTLTFLIDLCRLETLRLFSEQCPKRVRPKVRSESCESN